MSDGNNETLDASCYCASCGIAEIDDVKLVPCDGCDHVRYCSDDCQRDHKSRHEEDCKKRAAELRDELLFKQPESSLFGDCPICCLPVPLDPKKFIRAACCSKYICIGCDMAHQREDQDARRVQKCPFCRESLPATYEKCDEQTMKRVDANDPVALSHQGSDEYNKGNYHSAFELFTKAAELGNAWAHYNLALLYQKGKGVEKDKGKEIHHLEEAAIGGHPVARYSLGCHENDNFNGMIAIKHWIIAATQGDDKSIKMLMEVFKQGFLEKEVLATALRAHKAAVDATKSPQREEAEVYYRNL